MAEFRIYAAPAESVGQGWVWMGGAQRPDRCVVCIQSIDSGRSVYCEALSIDPNFVKHYNQNGGRKHITLDSVPPVLVISKWYREKLGIKSTQTVVELCVTTEESFIGKIGASIEHPQISVRISVWLGLIGVILGGLPLIWDIICKIYKGCTV